MAAAVGWDAEARCWRVLAASQVKGRRLLFLVLHELGHVVNGDVVKSDGWSSLQLDRAIMTGTARRTGLAAVRQSVLARSVSTSEGSGAEREADGWAEEQTAKYWAMVHRPFKRVIKMTR